MSEPKRYYDTTVDYLDHKGNGQAVVWRENELGNPKKLKLNIPLTLPGEKVHVQVDRPTKKRSRAHVTEFYETNPERVEAPCPHFEICGGCVWQHWSYDGQLNHKTEYVKRQLEQQGFDPARLVWRHHGIIEIKWNSHFLQKVIWVFMNKVISERCLI